MFSLDYPDKPLVCYCCYEIGHWRRDCRNPSVPITALLERPDLGQGGVKGSYAQAVRSKEAVEREKEQEEERKRKEDERLQEEERRKERVDEEIQKREELKKGNEEKIKQLNRLRK